MTPEGRVKKASREALRDMGALVIPINQQGIGARGVPDDLVLWEGKAFFIEYKAHMRWDTNRPAALRTLPTALQTVMMEKIREQGIATYVLDDRNWRGFSAALHSGGSLRPFRWIWSVDSFLAYAQADPETARAIAAQFVPDEWLRSPK